MIKEITERMIVEKAKNRSFEELVIYFELSKMNTVSLFHLEDEFASYKEKYPYE